MEVIDEVKSQTLKKTNEVDYPSILKRQQAGLIDFLLIAFFIFIGNLFFKEWFSENRNYQLMYYISLIFIYEPIFTTLGCTAGHYLTKIRIRKIKNPTSNITLLQSIIRFVFRVTLGWFGWLTIHRKDNMRALYDIFSGSIVIEKK